MSKCEVMVMTKKRIRPSKAIKLYGVELRKLHNVKYLGRFIGAKGGSREDLMRRGQQGKLFYRQQSADVKSMRDRIKAVARFVAAQMSGPDPHRKCDVHQLELHLNEIKATSVWAPTWSELCCLRSFADRVGLPCALVRGQYSRAWIEVAIPQEERGQDEGVDKPAVPLRLLRPNLIVDLMNNVGELLLLHSYEGDVYCGKPV
uniref:Uncharacterized protein n=1 Tax=Timema bartmani TaxID=61472 RepID=A0A7R9I3Z9_9NEOP|nr:unnamed protein product [Timema bartmani]